MAAGLRAGLHLFNDVLIDLGVAIRSDQLVEVYEVKTSVDRQSVYTPSDLAKALQRNGIELMLYDLTETAVIIR